MAGKKTYSQSKLEIAGLQIDVLRKNVKNLNLRVYPSDKSIRLSVPRRIPEKAILRFIQAKLPWIKKHLSTARPKQAKPNYEFVSGERHPVWGKEMELVVITKNKPPKVIINNEKLFLMVRPGSDKNKRASVLKEWYRAQLKTEIPLLIEQHEPIMGVQVKEFGVKQMKTRWGTCNIRDQRIWLNLELAKKRPALLEYVVIHEMVHLLERLHSKRFYRFMDQFLPNWKRLKDELNGKSSISDC